MLTQASPPPQSDLQALLLEVRALRTALDRTTFVGLRVQLVLHRPGQQQFTVNLARDRVRGAEGQLLYLKSQREHLTGRLKEIEQRKPVPERELLTMKAEAEALPRKQQEYEAMVIEAQQNLRMETAKLEDLNRQLDELERRLAEISK